MKPVVATAIATVFLVIACMALLALLTSLVVLLRRQPKIAPEPEPKWIGHGIDVSRIADRVHGVRSSFLSLLTSRPHEDLHRRQLLASTRKAVGQLAYFRNRADADPAASTHTAETHDA